MVCQTIIIKNTMLMFVTFLYKKLGMLVKR